MHPVYVIYHENPEISVITVKIFPSELLYSGGIEANKILALVRLKYTLTDITDIENPVLTDSGLLHTKFHAKMPTRDFCRQYL
jgi:hypothetical protein